MSEEEQIVSVMSKQEIARESKISNAVLGEIYSVYSVTSALQPQAKYDVGLTTSVAAKLIAKQMILIKFNA